MSRRWLVLVAMVLGMAAVSLLARGGGDPEPQPASAAAELNAPDARPG